MEESQVGWVLGTETTEQCIPALSVGLSGTEQLVDHSHGVPLVYNRVSK